MKNYQFTLILGNVDENIPMLEDKLYEASCDDALINFRNGAVYLDFDRQESSFEQAVISAIKNVECSSLGAIVIHVAPENFVSESEIAKRLQVNRQIVSLWIKGARRKKQAFPKPVMNLAEKSPFWKWSEVAAWLFNANLISDKTAVKNAIFLENLNAALEERNLSVRRARHNLLKKLVA